jgi:hypothetical protein
MQKATSRLIIMIALLSLALAVVLRFDLTVWVRGGYGWRWTYDPAPITRSLPLAVILLLYVAGSWWVLRRTRRVIITLFWAVCGALAVSLAATAIRDGDALYTLFVRTTSLLGTGPHWAANHIDWAGGEWRNWTAVMERFGGHMTNVPPASIAWYGLLNAALMQLPGIAEPMQRALLPYQCHNFDLLAYTPAQWASAIFGMLMPLWSALTIIPLYALAQRFVPRSSRQVVLWYALIPGLAAFAGSWSTIYALFSMTALWCLIKGLEGTRAPGWLVLSGLIAGLGLLTNFALLPLPVFLGLYVLVEMLLARRQPLIRAVLMGLWFAGGLLIPWLVYWLASGQTFFDLFATSMKFHLSLDRPYWFWLIMHPWDWVMWTGLGLALLGLFGLWRWWQVRRNLPVPTLSLTLFAAMFLLVVSGTARGETGRVWLFFSPFLLVAAAEGLHRISDDARHLSWLVVTAAQAVVLLALLTSLNVMGVNFTPPMLPPQVAVTRPADAAFSQNNQQPLFRLTGWDAKANNQSLTLHLQWSGLTEPTTAFWFGAALVSPGGETIGVPAWQPGGAAPYPTTCWLPGQTISDTVQITLPQNAPPGDWWISLAAYGDESASTSQLMVTQPGQPDDQQIGLGPITIR